VIISEVQRDLDFYLVEHPKDFPGTGIRGGYAQYHCNRAANMYSSAHWSYFRTEIEHRRSSMVINIELGKGILNRSTRLFRRHNGVRSIAVNCLDKLVRFFRNSQDVKPSIPSVPMTIALACFAWRN